MSEVEGNTFLARTWKHVAAQFAIQARAAITNFKIGEIQFKSAHVVAHFEEPITFHAGIAGASGIPSDAELHAPGTGDWVIRLSGFLIGKTGLPDALGLGTIDNIPFHGEIRIRLTAQLTLDTHDPSRPLVNTLDITPNITVDTNLVKIDQWTKIPLFEDGVSVPGRFVLQADAKVFLENLFPGRLSGVNPRGTITINPYAEPTIQLKVSSPVSKTFVLMQSLPLGIGNIFKNLQRGKLPLIWPPKEASTVVEPPAPTVTAVVSDMETAAAKIENDIVSHAPFGIVSDTNMRTAPGVVGTRLWDVRDSAIWTGHWLASEAFRWSFANDASQDTPAAIQSRKKEMDAASERINFILKGIEKLFIVPLESLKNVPLPTCNDLAPTMPAKSFKGLFCRAVIPDDLKNNTEFSFDNPQDKKNAFYSKGIQIDGKNWYGFGREEDVPSRDQMIGLVMGLGYLWELVPAFHPQIKDLYEPFLDYLLDNDWCLIAPQGPLPHPDGPTKVRFLVHSYYFLEIELQAAILRIGATINPAKYQDAYDKFTDSVAEWAWFSVWGNTLDPISKYYKFNLAYAGLGVLLFLEKDPALRKHYLIALRMLRGATAGHRNAYFNLVWILAHLPQERDALLTSPDGFNGKLSVEKETETLLLQWLQRSKIVGSNTSGILPLNKTPYPEYLTKLTENQAPLLRPYQVLGDNEARLLAVYPLPVHVRPGEGMDFIWQRDPCSTKLKNENGIWKVGGDNPSIEAPGVDFLLSYRIGRYLNLLHPALHQEVEEMVESIFFSQEETLPDFGKNIREFLRSLVALFAVVRPMIGGPVANIHIFSRVLVRAILGPQSPAPQNRLAVEKFYRDNNLGFDQHSWDNPNITFLEFHSINTGRSLQDALRLVLIALGVQARPDCELQINALLTNEKELLYSDVLLPPSARQAFRAVLARVNTDLGLDAPLPWGSTLFALTPFRRALADEIDAVLDLERIPG